ncbi:MAG: alpha/beta fold hydrolase, partial [Phycisphaerales bacterium]
MNTPVVNADTLGRTPSRRPMGGRLPTLLLVAVCALPAVWLPAMPEARADHRAGHNPPQGAAKVAFAPDFPALEDHEWGFPLGGFGGVRRGAPLRHAPVVFVHGNTVDHADWYPVRDDFRAAGWTDQELWALSYNGLGSAGGASPARANPEAEAEREEMGWDGTSRVTNNDRNVADLHDFVLAVRDYTGSDRFTLVGHSLGVTVARKLLKVHPELRGDLVTFVAIAGANHGTSLCPPGSEANVESCDEIAADTPWLAELNGPEGADETYGPARWLTVYDGSGGGDVAFLGPPYAQSPVLRGADNREFPGTDHNGLRMVASIVEVYRTFIEEAERAAGLDGGRAGDGRTGSGAAAGSGGSGTGGSGTGGSGGT